MWGVGYWGTAYWGIAYWGKTGAVAVTATPAYITWTLDAQNGVAALMMPNTRTRTTVTANENASTMIAQ